MQENNNLTTQQDDEDARFVDNSNNNITKNDLEIIKKNSINSNEQNITNQSQQDSDQQIKSSNQNILQIQQNEQSNQIQKNIEEQNDNLEINTNRLNTEEIVDLKTENKQNVKSNLFNSDILQIQANVNNVKKDNIFKSFQGANLEDKQSLGFSKKKQQEIESIQLRKRQDSEFDEQENLDTIKPLGETYKSPFNQNNSLISNGINNISKFKKQNTLNSQEKQSDNNQVSEETKKRPKLKLKSLFNKEKVQENDNKNNKKLSFFKKKSVVPLNSSNSNIDNSQSRKQSTIMNRQNLLQSFMAGKQQSNKASDFLTKIISDMQEGSDTNLGKQKKDNKQGTVNDQTITPSKKKEKRQFFYKIERVDRVQGYQIIYPPFILPLKSKAKIYYDIFIMFPIIWVALALPWEFAFPEDKNEIISILLLCIFIIDIFVNMRTTFYNEAFEEIIHPKLVALHYIKSRYFIVDLISAIPFDYIDGGGNEEDDSNPSFQVLKFLKMIRLARLGKLLNLISSSESYSYIQQLVKLFLGFLLLLHWLTLLWLALVKNNELKNEEDREFNNTWLPSNYRIIADSSQLEEDDLIIDFYAQNGYTQTEIYIYSYYSMLMVILGGEVTPVTVTQGFIATTMVFFGQITIAMIFASMGVILQKAYSKQQKYDKIVSDLEHLIKIHNVPKSIENKIHEYYEYCWRKNIMFDKDLVDFSDVSLTLRRELLVFIHQKVIINVPLFSELEQYEILSIIQKLNTQVFMPGESIMKINQLVKEMYFIDEGIVELFKAGVEEDQNQDDQNKYMLQNGDHFGEMAILTHWNSDIDVTSLIFSVVQTFSRKDYESIIRQYPDIEKRLKVGFKVYKLEDKDRQVEKMLYNNIFNNISIEKLDELYIEYMQDQYVDPETILLMPKEPMNAIYFILKGTVSIYQERYHGDEHLVLGRHNQFTELTIDDQIYELTGNKENQELYEILQKDINQIGKLGVGSVFGLCPTSEGDIKNNNDHLIIVSESSCQFAVITFNILKKLKDKDPELYKVLLRNIRKLEGTVDKNYINGIKTEQLDELEVQKVKEELHRNQKRFSKDQSELNKDQIHQLKEANNHLFYNTIKNINETKQKVTLLQKSSIDYKVSSVENLMQQTLSQMNIFQSKFKRVKNPGQV